MAWPSALSRTKDWGTETLTDADLEGQFDLIITYINDMMDATSGHKHDATTAEGPKILVSNLSLTNGVAGDTLYHNGTNLVRLAKGTAAQVLKMNAGATAPEWGDGTTYASQAEMEAATEAAKAVAPSTVKYHPGVAKAWCMFNGETTGTNAPTAGYGVTSVTRNGTGDYTVNLSVTFSSENYVVIGSARNTSDGYLECVIPKALAATTIQIYVRNQSDGLADCQYVSVVAFGDF